MLSFFSCCCSESILDEINCKLAYFELIIVDYFTDFGHTL